MLDQPALRLRPFDGIASELCQVARPAEHLQVSRCVSPAARERLNMVELQSTSLATVHAASFGARSDRVEISLRNRFAGRCEARSTVRLAGIAIRRQTFQSLRPIPTPLIVLPLLPRVLRVEPAQVLFYALGIGFLPFTDPGSRPLHMASARGSLVALDLLRMGEIVGACSTRLSRPEIRIAHFLFEQRALPHSLAPHTFPGPCLALGRVTTLARLPGKKAVQAEPLCFVA